MIRSKTSWLVWSMLAALSVPCLHAADQPRFRHERWTMNHQTPDPRPDILIHPLWDAHVEYRRRYNRPRCFTGWMANIIAPSSQEAMVWRENYCAGRYATHHHPPVYKQFMFPKPWEALQIGSPYRGSHQTTDSEVIEYEPAAVGDSDVVPQAEPAPAPPSAEGPPSPLRLDERSPSDRP